ncbi:unnamed protein product [Vitrella brassicaformis CCMP3155]|uniref:Uncharacterized protein n=1 Tax=Vitrella brassicaformis (strain CCMP3155) TaxID=1169540 RepID=A0A0G4EB03_VITBC|nr:unnamed protein product [Vitrella brassicaformis CCMP3155]|eukprot:CEL92638.1 unnamed protein product [Vitrella brassicaformis CCMP3155]
MYTAHTNPLNQVRSPRLASASHGTVDQSVSAQSTRRWCRDRAIPAAVAEQSAASRPPAAFFSILNGHQKPRCQDGGGAFACSSCNGRATVSADREGELGLVVSVFIALDEHTAIDRYNEWLVQGGPPVSKHAPCWPSAYQLLPVGLAAARAEPTSPGGDPVG